MLTQGSRSSNPGLKLANAFGVLEHSFVMLRSVL